MFPYWLLFGYFASGSLLNRDYSDRGTNAGYPLLKMGALLIALLIGLRYRVGGDWTAYERMFAFAKYNSLDRSLALGDPAYQLLNWSVQALGQEIWLVNLICGLIFSWGLIRFTLTQPSPWLATLVAIPYLVVVVAMGYSRQAVAIGILMAGLAGHLQRPSIFKFAAYVLVAALFHKTAVVVLPLIALGAGRNRFLNFIAAVILSFLFYDFFLSSAADRLVQNYFEAKYAAQGAAIRVTMSLFPAVLFLSSQHAFGFPDWERKLWRNFSLAAVVFFALLLLLPSSAAVDRMALYIIPLQIAILSRVPGSLVGRSLGLVVIVAYSFVVQFVWLNYAAHAELWVPYRFYPFE